MIAVETTVEISRPVAEVFDFVADQTNAPRWQDGLHEVRRLTEGPLGIGTEHEFVRRFAGRRVATRNRFVSFEEGRYVEFEIPAGWLTGQAAYLTEPGPGWHGADQPHAVSRPRSAGRGRACACPAARS